MNKYIMTGALAAALLVCGGASAQEVTASSLSSGTYEDGNYERSGDGFECKYFIDEARGTVTLSKIITNNREGKIEEGAEYEITNVMISEGISSLLVSREKKGQKIITAVREGDLGSFETLMIGADFYEFCYASNGRFYLEHGEVAASKR
ncbi:MAG: hypothetical protein GF409_00215 [Candidatus Omnitrophica bacterium]|nr:hypothetical protein [Candidatus Omnitrophota bacterium]